MYTEEYFVKQITEIKNRLAELETQAMQMSTASYKALSGKIADIENVLCEMSKE